MRRAPGGRGENLIPDERRKPRPGVDRLPDSETRGSPLGARRMAGMVTTARGNAPPGLLRTVDRRRRLKLTTL